MNPMRRIDARSLSPDVIRWLTSSQHPRFLHIFDRACNLINEHRDVLSIVTPEIGDGPFNLIVETDILFTESLNLASPISASADQLNLGDLIIHISNAKLWNPQPDWELLWSKKDEIVDLLLKLPIPTDQFSNSLISSLSSALVTADISTVKTFTSRLAGLGIGLTPAGDDFLMGALYAVWIIHPHDIASVLAQAIAETAAPLTTSLSAAWLRAAGKGEAGILWHEFFDASVSGNMQGIHDSMKKILDVGETSGADALSGFISVWMAYKEKELVRHENSSR